MERVKKILGKIDFMVFGIYGKEVSPLDVMRFYWERFMILGKRNSFKLSLATEEQCAGLVEVYGLSIIAGWRNYGVESQYGELLMTTAKESLITLLKANDCWTKEMKYAESVRNAALFDEAGATGGRRHAERWQVNKAMLAPGKKIEFTEYKEPEDYPDDFLILKLS